MLTGEYITLYNRLSAVIPKERLIHDDLRTLTFGTDASFYRLIPKLVIKVENEDEVIAVLREARRLKLPLTFRAAGTSLSGQAISDSVLVVLGRLWRNYEILENGAKIRLQPGVIGGHANMYLLPYGRKIGPDPASINSCMIGGIAANNSSGMCCGTAQNSYRTLAAMRIILNDGTLLDTSTSISRKHFVLSRRDIVDRITTLSQRVIQNRPLAERIRKKYTMKNTTGYSLNALVDFRDPIDIVQHLMIGSEGTLGFIAEVIYHTVPELPHKASALMLFPDIETACTAVPLLKACHVNAVELMDRASLRSVQHQEGMPEYLKSLDESVTALLVETRSENVKELRNHIAEIAKAIESLPKVRPLEFTNVPAEFARLWAIRKGLFPSVGAMREIGTSVIIEDVAFPVPRLAEATVELQSLFRRHGYHDGIIFGHALEGNLHFVFCQGFDSASEVQRYGDFMRDVSDMVVKKYDGSLKAEHGTGRNMAPFVELEWGPEAYTVMKEIKQIFDPDNLLNPDVILNADPEAHVKNLKPLPEAHPAVDKCIECGFCEVHCPSKDLTLTPRQRIVAYREISRLMATGENPARLRSIREQYEYYGDKTCATDGLCALSCPVSIDTGTLIKHLRMNSVSPAAVRVAGFVARNLGMVSRMMKVLLNSLDLVHRILGTEMMRTISVRMRRISPHAVPLWNEYLPKAADAIVRSTINELNPLKVVYFPSCVNRTMGIARGDEGADSLTTRTATLLKKAGFDIIYPKNLSNLCCGMPFASKGFKTLGNWKARELERALARASHQEKYPVYVDTSPCLYRMKETINQNLKLFEPVRFILEFAVDRLNFKKLPEVIAIHNTCSSRKMGLDESFKHLAEMCAEQVIVPEGIGCCGWAGDRGFTIPELTESALKDLKSKIAEGCHHGYSTSRTCEIGLSLHSGINYQSIVYLVDKCTTASGHLISSRHEVSLTASLGN